ncbi:hypothetical protein SAMN05444266_10998 [Chitinophaga jiangningensis]|uniref:Uncharacterized protein n=1 Tax=Chitinophaga jiangningensis TaxID=1419482 RepID=A0A1M7K1V7_9BACT|nr:hypothetical protein [Chitinophaga jiangningensis]SHM58787.1 hypothetical protein SAMN05444266_10998 [Chitinophaga jiangningensis]
MRKLLLVPLAFLFILSCRKPQNEPVHGDLIKNAKEFFDQNLKRNEFKNAKVSQIPNGELIWEQATIRSMSRATVVQVPLSSDSAGVTYGNHILPLSIKDYLFIYKDADSNYRSLVMRCIPHGSNGHGFSGLVLLSDWDGNNCRINALDGGAVSTTNARKTSSDGFNNAIRSCVTVNYWYSVNGGPWQFNFSNTFCTGDAGPEGPGENAPGDWQELPPPEGGGSSGSGSGETPGNMPPPPVILTDVVDELSSPCFKATLQYMGFNNLTSSLARTLSTLYQTSDVVNARFNEGQLADTVDAKNIPGVAGSGGAAVVNIDITLNNSIANGSREYIAATILHELIHGYFFVKYNVYNNNPWDHGQMAGDSFFNSMVLALQEMYPGISLADAQSLTWRGLEETPQYQALSLAQKQSIQSIAGKYRNGELGTKCN